MITKRCLRVYKGGDKVFHLQTNKLTTYNIGVRIDSADRYCPLASGSASNCINVRIGGADYHTVDYTPKLRFTYYSYSNSSPYVNPYKIQPQKIQLLNNVTINNPIYLFLKIGESYGSETWTNVLTLPANTVQATSGSEYRYYSQSGLGYIKVGNWQSSTFSVSNGSHTVDIAIPEAYWGV